MGRGEGHVGCVSRVGQDTWAVVRGREGNQAAGKMGSRASGRDGQEQRVGGNSKWAAFKKQGEWDRWWWGQRQ